MIPKSVAANRAVSMTVSMHTTVHCDSKGGTSGLSAFRAVVFGLGLSPKSEAVRKFYTCRKYSTIDNKQCVIVCASGSCVHVCMMYGAPPSHGQHQGELGQAARMTQQDRHMSQSCASPARTSTPGCRRQSIAPPATPTAGLTPRTRLRFEESLSAPFLAVWARKNKIGSWQSH